MLSERINNFYTEIMWDPSKVRIILRIFMALHTFGTRNWRFFDFYDLSSFTTETLKKSSKLWRKSTYGFLRWCNIEILNYCVATRAWMFENLSKNDLSYGFSYQKSIFSKCMTKNFNFSGSQLIFKAKNSQLSPDIANFNLVLSKHLNYIVFCKMFFFALTYDLWKGKIKILGIYLEKFDFW
jgi:hypothetical protein